MSAGGERVARGVTADESDPTGRVEELDRAEREAIDGGRWDDLDEVLEAQKRLWQELVAAARREDADDEGGPAAAALHALYRVRRRNHALIERSLADLRRRLVTAHAGTDARTAYRRTARRST